MIDWLRRQAQEPTVTIAGREVPLSIRRHPRATRLTMRLAPDGSEVRITLPQWGRTSDAMVFANKRIDWLERQLAALPPAQPPEPGGTIRYRGQPIRIDWNAAHARQPRPVEDRLQLGGPVETVPSRIRRWLEAEALRLFEDDLSHYCARAAVPEPALRLSRAVRRW